MSKRFTDQFLFALESGVTSRLMRDRISEKWVSVKEFGAVGDDSTNDHAAIQAAADHCFGTSGSPHGLSSAHLNKVLYFPPGRYVVNQPILLHKLVGAHVLGAGRYATRIRSTQVVSGTLGVDNNPDGAVFTT